MATRPLPAPKRPAGRVRTTKLTIEKLRAIRLAEIELGDNVALVGQNGTRKSSILRALNAFYNFDDEKADFENGSVQSTSGLRPKGSVTELARRSQRLAASCRRALCPAPRRGFGGCTP